MSKAVLVRSSGSGSGADLMAAMNQRALVGTFLKVDEIFTETDPKLKVKKLEALVEVDPVGVQPYMEVFSKTGNQAFRKRAKTLAEELARRPVQKANQELVA